MTNLGFWEELFSSGPVMGLSPMDGVTDAAMRYMVAKYGTSQISDDSKFGGFGRGVNVMFTEFISVDGLAYAKQPEAVDRLMSAFIRARDVGLLVDSVGLRWPYEVAQVFGHTPELFYQAAVIVATLGYDGMDINMGCPAHKVEEHGSGAGLIRTPDIAQEIVRQAKRGVEDYAKGKVTIDDLEISEAIKEWVRSHAQVSANPNTRKSAIPVSVKTRIGVDKDVVQAWMETLMEVEPAVISLHGRTLKQLYQGQADWEAIGRAAEVVHKLGGHILGNGDVQSATDGMEKVKKYGVDGFLIGRAAEGNPWVFGECSPMEIPWEMRKKWILEHAEVYEVVFGKDHFVPMRKHLAWYCKGIEGASEMRGRLVRAKCLSDVKEILASSPYSG